MNLIFLELTVILVLASILAILFRFIKQPSILAYILAGILIGPIGLFHITNHEVVEGMAQIGIALLLFMLGLEMKLSDLKSVGKIAIITGVGQILFTSAVGYVIAIILGFSTLAALYVAVALTFSSTIIIVKLLSDKKDLNSLYGKISVGFLLVQDFFAIVALIILSSFTAGDGSGVSVIDIGVVLLKGVALFALVIFLSKSILPKIINKIAKSGELLFIFGLAWAFGISMLVSSPWVGFSIEIGGFLAGLALANSSESLHIASRTKSLRDFFIVIFFVTLGMGMTITNLNEILIPAIIFSAFVLIGNPIIVMIIMGLLGYKKRTSFLAGLTVAQISEFSLIVIFLGNRLGHLDSNVVSLVTLVGVITFGVSTYMIMNGNFLFKKLSPILDIFERKNTTKEKAPDLGELSGHVVLAGVNRAGSSILDTVADEKGDKLVVVDFNPDVVRRLSEKNIKVLFGDIADADIVRSAHIDKAKVVVSTVSDLDDNLYLLKSIKESGKNVRTIFVARDNSDAVILYMSGADYVVVPHVTSGHHIARIIKEERIDDIDMLREKELKKLGVNKD